MDENLPVVSLHDPKNNNIVKKAEQLVTSRYTLSIIEIKIISKLITMVNVSDTEFTEYAFRVSEWKNDLKLKRKDMYKALEDVADDLLSRPLTIRSNDGDWLKVNWVSSARYIDKEGIVKFQISDKLKPYLLTLKSHFLQYDIRNILPLKSTYVIRIYELLKDWYSAGTRYDRKIKKVTKIVELVWLRQTFQIPTGYKYGNIKKQILQKAIVDLPKYTDINFQYEEIKETRKVTHIKFIIQQKGQGASVLPNQAQGQTRQQKSQNGNQLQQKQLYENENERQKMALLLSILPAQYQHKSAENLLNKYLDKGAGYIKAQIKYTNNAETKSYLAYLKKALESDYAGFEKSAIAEDIKAEKEAQMAGKARAEEDKKVAEKAEWDKYATRYDNLSVTKRDNWIYKVAAHSKTIQRYITKGIENGIDKHEELIKAMVIGEMRDDAHRGQDQKIQTEPEMSEEDLKAKENREMLDDGLSKL